MPIYKIWWLTKNSDFGKRFQQTYNMYYASFSNSKTFWTVVIQLIFAYFFFFFNLTQSFSFVFRPTSAIIRDYDAFIRNLGSYQIFRTQKNNVTIQTWNHCILFRTVAFRHICYILLLIDSSYDCMKFVSKFLCTPKGRY